jgi:hypothetical protein
MNNTTEISEDLILDRWESTFKMMCKRKERLFQIENSMFVCIMADYAAHNWINIFRKTGFTPTIPVDDWVNIIQSAKEMHLSGALSLLHSIHLVFKPGKSYHGAQKRKKLR